MLMDVIILAVIGLCIFIGHKRGFIRSLCNLLSFALSAVIAFLTYGKIAEVLAASPIGKFISDKIATDIGNAAVDFSSVPPALSGLLREGAANVAGAVAHNLTVVVLGVVAFIVTIIVAKIILSFVFKSLDILAKLPVIKQCNKILGCVSGAITGYFIACIIAFAVSQITLMPNAGVVGTLANGSILVPFISSVNIFGAFLA